jgi:hypothetical protein
MPVPRRRCGYVDDLDRLARLDLRELGELLSPLRKAGVWVESVAQGRMDYHSMGGRLLLGMTAEAARKALWLLESALEGDDRCLLKEALRGILARMTVGGDPYPTTTGRTRHRARRDGISLRPGSGLDTLSLRSASSLASTP